MSLLFADDHRPPMFSYRPQKLSTRSASAPLLYIAFISLASHYTSHIAPPSLIFRLRINLAPITIRLSFRSHLVC